MVSSEHYRLRVERSEHTHSVDDIDYIPQRLETQTIFLKLAKRHPPSCRLPNDPLPKFTAVFETIVRPLKNTRHLLEDSSSNNSLTSRRNNKEVMAISVFRDSV